MIGPGGETISGRGELDGDAAPFDRAGDEIRDRGRGLYDAGAVALALGTLTMRTARGEAFEQTSSGTVVYARAEDGWRIAIDAPWGLPEGRVQGRARRRGTS